MQMQESRYTLMGIPEGEAGTWETLALMSELVNRYKVEPKIRALALSIVAGLSGKDFAGEARAIFSWVRSNIRYVMDINGVETLHSPDKVLEIGQGDCDDMAVLFATLLESIGHPTRFVAVGKVPGEFEHVYTETKIGSAWIAGDPTEPFDFGWKPRGMVAKMVKWN